MITQLNIQIQQIATNDYCYSVSFVFRMAKYKKSGNAINPVVAFELANNYIAQITRGATE